MFQLYFIDGVLTYNYDLNDGHSKILYLFEEKPNGKFKRNGWFGKAAKR